MIQQKVTNIKIGAQYLTRLMKHIIVRDDVKHIVAKAKMNFGTWIVFNDSAERFKQIGGHPNGALIASMPHACKTPQNI